MQPKKTISFCAFAAYALNASIVWGGGYPECMMGPPLPGGVMNIMLAPTLSDESYAAGCIQNHIERWSDLPVRFESVGSTETARERLEDLSANIVVVEDMREEGFQQIQIAASALLSEGWEPANTTYPNPDFEILAHGAFTTNGLKFYGMEDFRSDISSYEPTAMLRHGNIEAQHFMYVNVNCE